MKKIIIICANLVLSISCIGQNISNLDDNNGFKEFQFGDSKSKWLSSLDKRNTSDASEYNYTGTCCNTAFGFAVSNILLRFDSQDKLTQVILLMRDNQLSAGYTQFRNAIFAAFGPYNASVIDNHNSGDMTLQWVGNKVVLTMLNEYKGVDKGGWEITIYFNLKSNTTSVTKDY